MFAPRARFAIPLIAFALALAAPPALDAQGMLGRVKKKAEEAAKKKVDDRTEKKAGETSEAATDKVECKVSDQACIDKAQAEGKEVVTITESGGAAAVGADVNTMKPGQGAWANYDFKPGDQILFIDDFTKDEVGDFPRRMEFSTGALEIVEWQGGRWLRANEDSKWYIPLPDVRPERFTMEFDYYIPSGEVWIYFSDQQNTRLDFRGMGGANVSNNAAKVNASFNEPAGKAKIRRARLMVDGKYAKVYLDDKRVLNVPNANLEQSNKILFFTDGHADNPSLFGNFRLAAGGKKLYDAIAATGRVATQGIYFDSGSDRVRPESSPTLKEIAQMLTEHPDLAITIEGHTDNIGSAQANQELSNKRAAAVKQALVSTYSIDAARLTSTGFGDTKPVAKNDTPEGRQQNRRVELVRT
jgi:outer membrane protein OmpA-like peptidoglycan-associated protein